jgi:excisionase family DNA binding protein
MDSFEKMLTVKEAALSVLCVSPDTVRRLIRRGELKAWKLPGRSDRRKRKFEVYRIAYSELTRFMKRNGC